MNSTNTSSNFRSVRIVIIKILVNQIQVGLEYEQEQIKLFRELRKFGYLYFLYSDIQFKYVVKQLVSVTSQERKQSSTVNCI